VNPSDLIKILRSFKLKIVIQAELVPQEPICPVCLRMKSEIRTCARPECPRRELDDLLDWIDTFKNGDQ
jgi:hypothetical protein